MSPERLQKMTRGDGSAAALVRKGSVRGGIQAPLRSDVVSVSLQVNVLILAMIGVATFAVAVEEGQFTWRRALWLTLQLVAMALAGWQMRRVSSVWRTPPAITPILVGLALTAFLWDFLRRWWFGEGLPFELLTMSASRNVLLGLGPVCVWRTYQPSCVVMSLFLSMFGATSTHDTAAQVLAATFAVAAIAWLVVSHWERVRSRLKGKQSSMLPRSLVVVPLLLLAVGSLSLAAADRRVTQALSGWLPSSGGDGRADHNARGGIGDGEMLVAGTNHIQSFAPIDDAPFMQDDQPALYDIFDDTYEEEVVTKNQDRAIGLTADPESPIRQHLHSRVEKANREFSTLRQTSQKKPSRPVDDIRSDALFYVAGRVPLHLRLQLYDRFDGVKWHPEPPIEGPSVEFPLRLVESSGKPWITLPDRVDNWDFLAPAETHAIKVVRLDTNIIPAPAFLHGVHVDLVDRIDMFGYGPDGLIRMERKSLPRLVPIHIASRSVDSSCFSTEASLFLKTSHPHHYTSLPATLDLERWRKLAQNWVSGHAVGWDQISAIVTRLQQDYRHDHHARPPADSHDPTGHFLFESKAGPDYQFATAAALLLRSLGYPCRVVSGFYASDAKYDHRSRHTPVLAEDVHFWVEVRAGVSDWVTIDPTPGYRVLGPPPSLWKRAWGVLTVSLQWLLNHIAAVFVTSTIGLAGYYFRRQLMDWLDELRWRFNPCQTAASTTLSTLMLLDRRARRAGCGRPDGKTSSRWLNELVSREPRLQSTLSTFARDTDWAAFASPQMSNQRRFELDRSTYRELVSQLSLSWFQNQIGDESRA